MKEQYNKANRAKWEQSENLGKGHMGVPCAIL